MIARPEALEKLLAYLRKLPSVGPKMSERMAFHILRESPEEFRELLGALETAFETVRPCATCGYWDDQDPCRICADLSRDKSLLCVVESSQDLVAMSRVRNFSGYYHVLGGALSPLQGVGPQDLRLEPLLRRLESGEIKEVILGLSADMEGEATAQFLTEQIEVLSLSGAKVTITRLAQGLPAGGELEYMDELTLSKAFEGRRQVIHSSNN